MQAVYSAAQCKYSEQHFPTHPSSQKLSGAGGALHSPAHLQPPRPPSSLHVLPPAIVQNHLRDSRSEGLDTGQLLGPVGQIALGLLQYVAMPATHKSIERPFVKACYREHTLPTLRPPCQSGPGLSRQYLPLRLPQPRPLPLPIPLPPPPPGLCRHIAESYSSTPAQLQA